MKELQFQLSPLDLEAQENVSPSYAAISITCRIPTLIDGDFALSESSAISEYLEDVYPGHRLYPEDAQQRARARQLQAWLRSDLMALRSERGTEVVFCRLSAAPLSAAGQIAADKLLQAASSLLQHGGPNLFGAWSIADSDLSLMLNRLILNGDAVPANLQEYAQRQWQLPAVQEWVHLERR